MSDVPQIDSNSESVAPDYPTYTLASGEIVEVASPSELGLRQIQKLLRLSTRIRPLSGMLSGIENDEDEDELSDEEFEAAIHAAQAFVRLTSKMTDEQIESMHDLEYVGYMTGFLEELSSSINVSTQLRFR